MRIVVETESAGARLDKLLVDRIPGLGRASAKRLFTERRVRVFTNGEGRGRLGSKGDVAAAGDVIEVEIEPTEDASRAVADPSVELSIALETKDVVLVDKRAGFPSAPILPGEKGTIANALLARYPEMAGVGFSPREPGLCHRLDTGTSGLLLAARTPAAFTTLTTALKEGRLDKRYLLLVKAEDLPDSGTIEIPLAPHPKDKRRVYACVHPRDVARYAPRPASTSWKKISEKDGIALVEASASKAARHQIRAHFAAIDHPLFGDPLYGGEVVTGLSRHALHASRIVWKGDADVPAFDVASPLPHDLARFVD